MTFGEVWKRHTTFSYGYNVKTSLPQNVLVEFERAKKALRTAQILHVRKARLDASMVKAIDIFGNDISQVFAAEVK